MLDKYICFIAAIIAILLLPIDAGHALSVSAGLGVGQTATTNQYSTTEGPFVQAYSVEQLVHSRLSLGVEHIRSLKSSLNSSASVTGVLGRYYFNAGPVANMPAETVPTDTIITRDIGYYMSAGLGVAQSSILPNATGQSSNAAGLALTIRGGAEFPMDGHWGVRAEGIFSTLVFGSGSLSIESVGASLYWLF